MHWTTIAIAVSIFFAAALLIGLSIPLVQGKVPPNSAYGFRTSKTLADPSIWYEANRFAGRVTINVSIVMIALGIALLHPRSLHQARSQQPNRTGAGF
jgi:uncharacterized membrane protein